MGLILLLVVLVLLFGGGGFYMGPPFHYYGGGLGTILIIVIIFLLLRRCRDCSPLTRGRLSWRPFLFGEQRAVSFAASRKRRGPTHMPRLSNLSHALSGGVHKLAS